MNFFVKNNTINLIIGIPGLIMIVNLEIKYIKDRIKLNGLLNEKTQFRLSTDEEISMTNFAKIKKLLDDVIFRSMGNHTIFEY